MSNWEHFYQKTVNARYKAMITALNERRREAGVRCMSPTSLAFIRKFGCREFDGARLIRDCGILVPPPDVLINSNEITPYMGRVFGAFDELVDEVVAHEDRGLDWWSWPI